MDRAVTKNAVVYRGKSLLTGDPILVALTGLAAWRSRNPKVGDAVTAWILRADMSPTDAVKSGADRAICGDCSLRGDGRTGRKCYVTYWQAPLQVWKAIGKYQDVMPEDMTGHLRGRVVRLGGYGDPSAVPLHTWAMLLQRAGGWVGYTQHWRTCDPGLRFYCMASVTSERESREAQGLGWRTYRVRRVGQALAAGEVVCPASQEAGHKLTCVECRLCGGAAFQKANVAILVHGKPGNRSAFNAAGLDRVDGRKLVHLQPV